MAAAGLLAPLVALRTPQPVIAGVALAYLPERLRARIFEWALVHPTNHLGIRFDAAWGDDGITFLFHTPTRRYARTLRVWPRFLPEATVREAAEDLAAMYLGTGK